MFLFAIALALLLIALVGGVSLLIWGYQSDLSLGKVFGYIVVIISSLALLGMVFHGVKYIGKVGYKGSCHSYMMKKHIMDKPLIKKRMLEQKAIKSQ